MYMPTTTSVRGVLRDNTSLLSTEQIRVYETSWSAGASQLAVRTVPFRDSVKFGGAVYVIDKIYK